MINKQSPAVTIGSKVYSRYGREFIVEETQDWIYCGADDHRAYRVPRYHGCGPEYRRPALVLLVRATDDRNIRTQILREDVVIKGDQMRLF